MSLSVKVLGTGTSVGVPMVSCNCNVCLSNNPKDNRTRSSILVESQGYKILIDAGPDIRSQFLKNNITDIDLVLLTHEHNDHIIGLDDLRPVCFLNKKTIPIWGEERVLENVKNRFPYLFAQNRFGVKVLNPKSISPGKLEFEDLRFDAFRVDHGGLPILGFKFSQFAYVTDAKTLEEASLEKLEGIDTLIINALQIKPHFKHLNLKGCLEIIKKLNPAKCYLTHLSHKLPMHEELEKILPENVFVAYDGLQINVDA